MAVAVLMSAIVPTTGHRDLIHFAQRFAALVNQHVVVYIGWRKGEPTEYYQRANALQRDMPVGWEAPNFIPVNESGWTPQDAVNHYNTLIRPTDYVVSSEEYAKELNGISIPYDIDRLNDPVHGTDVRKHLLADFQSVTPSFRKYVGLRVTLFGQESVGKSTTTLALSRFPHITGRAEFARPYLEHQPTSGYDLVDMDRIWMGQKALQEMPLNSPILVQDTDLYSTVGYYDIMGEPVPYGITLDAEHTKSDLYIILDPAGAPFTADPLRYGGDHRESSLEFWTERAERWGLNYVVKTATEALDQKYLYDAWEAKTKAIREYVRP